MLNLFNNFYMVPANMMLYPKPHSFVSSIDPKHLAFIHFEDTPVAKSISQGPSISTCFGGMSPEEVMSTTAKDKLVILYADGPSYREFFARFIKTAFPSISKEDANALFIFIGESVKFMTTRFTLLGLHGETIYTIDDLDRDYFSDELNLDVEPFDISLSELGLDWMLFDRLYVGKSQFSKKLTDSVNKAYRNVLNREIKSVGGVHEYFGVDFTPDNISDDNVIDLATKVGNLNISNSGLCDDIAKTGKLRTADSLIKNLESPNVNSDLVSFICKYNRSSGFLLWLAIKSKRDGTKLPIIGE